MDIPGTRRSPDVFIVLKIRHENQLRLNGGNTHIEGIVRRFLCELPESEQVVNLYNILLRRLELPFLRCLFLRFLSATKTSKRK